MSRVTRGYGVRRPHARNFPITFYTGLKNIRVPSPSDSALLKQTSLLAALTNEIDPLCKLVSERITDPNNQHYRFCVAVSRSAYFKDKVKYPPPTSGHGCRERKISFRTEEGVTEVATKSYYERMTPCYLTHVDPREGESVRLFISRAYLSNQVLVYRRDSADAKIYLENLSTRVSILDELNSFDFVEE
jgi:hypothetical protein